MTEHHDTVKHILDWVSIATALGAFVNVLPALAAGLSVVWTLMRIAEMVTGKPFAEIIRWKKPDAVDK
jgi:hypothetical protein